MRFLQLIRLSRRVNQFELANETDFESVGKQELVKFNLDMQNT